MNTTSVTMRSINQWTLSKIIKSPNDKVAFLYFDIEWGLEFQAWQFVVLDMKIGWNSVKRSYSIATTPDDLKSKKQIGIIVKRVEDGLMSNALMDMDIWDSLTIIWPAWHMHLDIDQNNIKTNYVLISTWSGLSPIYSILQTLTSKSIYNNIVNIFWERDDGHIIRETISCLTMSQDNASSYIALSRQSWDIWYNFKSGYVQLCLDQQIDRIKSWEWITKRYICGQPTMVEDIYDKLINQYNIDQKNISFEKY